jgi:hypothetical protein
MTRNETEVFDACFMFHRNEAQVMKSTQALQESDGDSSSSDGDEAPSSRFVPPVPPLPTPPNGSGGGDPQDH